MSFKNCWTISSSYDFQAHQQRLHKRHISQTDQLWFDVLPGLSPAPPGAPWLVVGSPRLVTGAPKVLSGAPKCSQTYHKHSHGTPVLAIRDPSCSEGRPDCPPRVWFPPEIDACEFTLRILSDTPGGFQWLQYILLMAGELTNHTMVHTGRWPHHWIRQRGYRNGSGSRLAGGGGPWKGRRMEYSRNDRGGRGVSREVIDGASEWDDSAQSRVPSRSGGATSRKVWRTIGPCSRRHTKERQDLCQIKQVVGLQQPKKKKRGQKTDMELEELGRGWHG